MKLRGYFIRELRTGDVPKLYRMYGSLSEEAKYFFHPPFFLKTTCAWRGLAQTALVLSTIKPLRELLLRLFPFPAFLPIVAVDRRGEVVGFAFLKIRSLLPSREPSAELGVVVSDPLQGRGLGSRLIEELLKIAARRGIKEVFLSVLPDNVRAIHLYEKFGFRFIGETVDYWEGRRLKAKVMKLSLRRSTAMLPIEEAGKG
ncbi:MAG: GNAT family N-acetyltransferase [Candidatus Nezhaarchaeota archaeon]|nr:GNAT family N-acetyltransferase [Candidatus Nezhaarchaeota archaeon]